MTFPRSRWQPADLDIRNMDAVEPNATFLDTAFQIIHHEGRYGHVSDVQFCLCSCYLKPHMEPSLSGNVDGGGEPRAVIDLPGSGAQEQRRILLCVVQPGFMRPQIHQFAFAVGLGAERNVIESARLGSGHIYIDYAICEFEIPERGPLIFQREAVPAKVIRDLRSWPELPSWRIGWK